MADDKRLCVIPYQGADYPFSPRDITISRLRYMKQKYGRDYGTYLTFVQLFLQGDADAIACAIWIVLSKAGKEKPPELIEFSPVDIFDAIQRQNEEDQAAALAEGEESEDPTTEVAPPVTATTSDSLSQPTDQETSTSGS